MAKKTETMEIAKVEPATIAVPDGFNDAWGPAAEQAGLIRWVIVQPVVADETHIPGQFVNCTTELCAPTLDVSLLANTERCHHPAYDEAGKQIRDAVSPCWSDDGVRPSARVMQPFACTCRVPGAYGRLEPECPELCWPADRASKPRCNFQICLALYEWTSGMPGLFVCQKTAIPVARKLLANLNARARSVDRGAMPWHYRMTIKTTKVLTAQGSSYYVPCFDSIRVDRESGDQIAHLAPAVKTADVQAMVATEKGQDEIPF